MVCARAEEWPAARRRDVGRARALAALPVLCEYAAPLLAEGGARGLEGRRDAGEEADGGRGGGRDLGLEPVEVVPCEPFPAAERRTLHVFHKVAPTPDALPAPAGNGPQAPAG